MATFEIGNQYTRAEVQEALSVPQDRRHGNWDTGYTEFDGEFYIFCNIGIAGRTGHDYENYWDGDTLVWRAKNQTNVLQPLIVRLISGDQPVHIFHRAEDRRPFTYAGAARARDVEDVTPVKVRWSFYAPAPGNVGRNMIEQVLSGAGFLLADAGVKTRRATLGDLIIYTKQETRDFPLVIDPSWEDRTTELMAVGATRPANRFFYHNSTMLDFPKRQHTGRQPIPFGIDFAFPDSSSLVRFVSVLKTGRPQSQKRGQIEDAMNVDPRTETEAVRAARLGQQKFRQDLLDRYAGACALTSIDMPEMLRASHIVPWCDATPRERHDPDNGILLAVHIDSLFDRGFISFTDDGGLLLSRTISDTVLTTFGLNETMTLKVNERNREYLKRHRERHFG